MQPLLVQVTEDGHRRRARLLIDGTPVAWEDFGAVLRKELNRRPPDWPVYVQGDPELEWRQVVEAVDEIRGVQGEVILLTGEKR
jgi:biopolymer transport protein ExbD